MNYEKARDEELLVATPRDGRAFEAFFRRHAQPVLAFFARRVEGPEVAADLMAETFAAALLAAGRYRAQEQPASAWLYAIARHKLVDYQRRRATNLRALRRIGVERLELEDADLARIDQLSNGPDLAVLSNDERQAVEAHVIHERDYADIAAEAGTTQAAIRQRVSRGLKTLRKGLPR